MAKSIQSAKWAVMKRHRDLFGPADQEKVLVQLRHKPVRIGQRKNKKTGEVEKTVGGGPKIVLDGVMHYMSGKGKPIPVTGASLFTWTTKMSCPSFSLPAGPCQFGGTCHASLPNEVKADGSYHDLYPIDISQGRYICSICYAGKGNYMQYPGVSIRQVVHLAWTKKAVADGTFVDSIASAIESIQDDEEKLMAEVGTSTHYFRIHDSGDFSIDEDDEVSFAYYRAWCEVAEAMSHIKFWAPTRLWVFDKWRKLFDETSLPDNLSLRPSGLILDAPPPDIDGLDAGTMCHIGDTADAVSCPAYKEKTKTCHSSGCRRCWDKKDAFINYWTH